MNEFKPRYVKMKSLKELVKSGLIEIVHMSDDGEFCRFKILPSGPEVGQWCQFDQVLMVVDRETVHENFVNAAAQLYEEIKE